jgi:protein-tyrosine-phosphatase
MKYVLFVCTHNAGRSQIAQAFFERVAPDDLRAESPGQEPAADIWADVVEAMRDVGIDISGRNPKKIEVEMQLHADKAITLNCQGSCPYVIGGVEDWEVDDPPASRSRKYARSATTSNAVSANSSTRADEIRNDRGGMIAASPSSSPRSSMSSVRPRPGVRPCARLTWARLA